MHPQLATRRHALKEGGLALAALLSLVAGGAAVAQPTLEQLHLLCSGPAGSIPDIIARRIAEPLSGRLARHVTVDNRPGAAGQIAVNALLAGPADGSTLLLAQGAIATVYPYLYPKLAYDATADLQPVSLAGEMTLGLAVGPAVPESVGDVRSFIDWMRRNPKLANVASPGTGTLPHLLEVMLFHEADVPWQHIVYSGGPPAMVALLGGQVAALVLPEGLLRQHQASGKLRVLATSGAQRTAFLPAVPTLVEQGWRRLIVREWFAFFMSTRVSAATVAATAQSLRMAIERPEVAAAFAESGMVAVASTPAALVARIATEQGNWEPIIRAANVRVE